jgi:ribosomal-protein-alanine N-acetyltransferase
MRDAAGRGARGMLLEVRPSNAPALALYRSSGFEAIGVRRGYYPAEDGREDAHVLFRQLGS